MAPYVTSRELEDALGTSTFVGVFGDSGSDIINEAAVSLVLRAAHADVERFALRGYDGPLPDPPPDALWALELDFARARAYMRGDSYSRDMGERLLKEASKNAADIAKGLQRGSEGQPNPTPALSPEPPVPPGAEVAPVDFGGGTSPSEVFWDPSRGR